MRKGLLVGVVLASGIWQGCGGGGGASFSPLLPDTLDHDAARVFVGRWYGSATLTLDGRSSSGDIYLDVAATGRNLLTFPEFCGDGLGPAARVISDDAFEVAGYRCPIPEDGCTVTWDIHGGRGDLSEASVLTLSLEGVASGCGLSGSAMSIVFAGTRGSIDGGPPTAAVARDSLVARPDVDTTLDASPSSDPDGRALSFAWTVTSKPAGGDPVLGGADTATPTFRATIPGIYLVQVMVTAADGQWASAVVTVTVSPPPVAIAALPRGVLDAEYDRALDRIVMTDASTRALYVYDPATGAEAPVPLPLAPRCLSVSRDGARALVGHQGWITIVDVAAAQVEATLPTATDPGACLLGSGWAYLFPVDSWIALRSVDLASGAESGGGRPYTGSRGVLTPDGATIYAVTIDLSPASLDRWDASGGAATWAWEQTAAAGDHLWMERSGARIFTSVGTAFRTSSVQSQDMAYAGSLQDLTAVAHLDTSAEQLAAIPAASRWDPSTAAADCRFELFDPDGLTRAGRIYLPAWGVEGALTHGRFVFYGAGGSKHVLVQADPGTGLARDWAVLTYQGTELVPQPTGGDHGPPQAVIAQAPLGRPGVALPLDGTASRDPDGLALAFQWEILRQPGTGATLADAGTATPSLTATFPGAYALKLTVTAADGQKGAATAIVTIFPAALPALSHGVADAEYSRALDRIVMTDGNPSALYVYDPASRAETMIALPSAPQCVGVSPDGTHAVVGHAGSISYVDLVEGALEKTIPVAADVGDCVLGGNGWAYLFPRVDQWVTIHNVELSTGLDTPTGSNIVYAGARARLHPGGTSLYSLDTRLSPAQLYRWDISGGAAALARESPYWGEYAIGPDLWMAADGSRLLTAAGTAFRTTDAPATDMTYAGALEGMGLVASIDAAAGEVAAIRGTYAYDPSTAMNDTTLELFDAIYLGHLGSIALPTWTVAGRAYATHGRFVFHGADSATRYVIVEADASSGLLHGTAVLTY